MQYKVNVRQFLWQTNDVHSYSNNHIIYTGMKL